MKTKIAISLFYLAGSLFSQVPELRVTFPAGVDTIAYGQVRIAGYAEPGSRVLVNDKSVHLYPHGAFVSQVPLLNTHNRIIVTAIKGGQSAQDTLYIYRPPSSQISPVIPTQFDAADIYPEKDVWISPGDYLNLHFKGSPGGRASFSIDNLFSAIPMTELARHQADAMPGIYNGVVRIPTTVVNKSLEIKYELQGRDSKKISARAIGRLYILPEKIPIVGGLKEATYIHNAEKSYTPVSRLQQGVRLHIVGKFGDRYKIRLGSGRSGFIDSDKVQVMPLGTPLPFAAVSAPVISDDANWWILSMTTDIRVPWSTSHDIENRTVELDLYGAYQSSTWTTLPNYDTEIKSFTMTSPGDGLLKLKVAMDQPALWGHRVVYENGRLIFAIRKSPPFNNSANPLAGITIAIDPGHGGENDGTTSPIGLLEKDINLQWAAKLRSRLIGAGASVVMTRTGDQELSLDERLQRAAEGNALILISLHNNSTTPAGNPVTARGTGIFFTLEQNKELAFSIFPHMVKLGLAPYGRVKNSYYVTNFTESLVVLVEGLFMSNPEEERLLLQPGFIDRMADAVYNGLDDFMKNRRQLYQRSP